MADKCNWPISPTQTLEFSIYDRNQDWNDEQYHQVLGQHQGGHSAGSGSRWRHGGLSEVLVIGWDDQDALYCASSTSDIGEHLLMLGRAKQALLE